MRPRVATIRGVFHAWRHFIRFRALRKLAHRCSRLARQQKQDELLAQAEQYAQRHNMHQLYRIIRLMAPRQRYKKVQLYGREGHMLSRDQEVEEFKQHLDKVYRGDDFQDIVKTAECPDLFSADELQSAFSHIPVYKATPPHMAPGPVWRAAAKGLALLVAREFPKLCAHPLPRVPQYWRDGWLTLFCKPGKPGRRPEDYRPICLQDPVGKAVLSLLAARIKPVVQAYASDCQQHAYLPGRSTEGALLWIFHKCRLIRELAESSRRTIYDKRYNTSATDPYTGGMVLSLDMSLAFDSVPRSYIQASLLDAGIALPEIQLIMHWLHGSEYHLTHGHVNLRILTQRGVRQGCVLSPLLWSCFTCYVAKHLPQTLRKQDLQMYADDFLMYWIFRSRADFHRALASIPTFLAALRAFGLHINLSKTAVLIRMAHPPGQDELRKHVVTNNKGTFLSLFGSLPEFVPLVKQHKYLGCIISLFDFEALTIRHRISVGRNQFTRLRKVLTSRKHLTLARRARIWDACIWSSLSYGLICCGFTGYSFCKLAEVIATQLRAVARSPRHIFHETNEVLRARLHIQDPAQRLQQMHHGLVQRLLSGYRYLPEHDVMRNPDFMAQAQHVSRLLSAIRDSQPCLIPLQPQAGVACPECGLYFVDESAVRKHLAVKHPDLHTAEPVDMDSINRNAISIDGMPVCSGCRVNFCSWQKLLQHVRYRRCPGLRYDTSEGVVPVGSYYDTANGQKASDDRTRPMSTVLASGIEGAATDPDNTVQSTSVADLPLLKRRQLVQTWVSGGSRQCIRDLANTDLSKECREHCCICRQWIADTRHMKQHIKQSHPHVYAKFHQLVAADCAALSGTVLASQPCPYCHRSATTRPKRHAEMCTVLYQVALVCRAHVGDGNDTSRAGDHLTLRGLSPVVVNSSTAGQKTGGPGQAGSTQASTSGIQGHERDAEQGQGQREPGRGKLTDWFRVQPVVHTQPAGGGGHQGSDPHAYAGLDSSRRPHQPSSVGSLLSTVDEDQQPGNHVAQHCGGIQGMEGEARSGHNGHVTEGDAIPLPYGGAQESGYANGGESGAARKAGHGRLASSEGWTGTHVESHDVEPNGGEGNSGARPGTHGSVGRPLADRQAIGGDRLAHTSTFPLHKATDQRLPQRDGVLSSGDLESRHHGHKAPSSTGDTLSLLSDVPDRRSPSTRNPEALPSDRQDVQNSLFLVLHLALHNPDNICYQNSFVLALIWTYLHTQLQEGREHGRGRGTITEAFCSAILTLRSTALASLQVWKDLLRGWRQPHRQHDVCEFACFVLAKLRPNMLQGEWSARRHDSELGEFDHGCLFSPIPLRIPANAHSIQDCIHSWNDQARTTAHALTHAVDVVVIQLARFTQLSGGRYRKFTGQIVDLHHIRMPIFSNGLQSQWIPFSLCAGIVHIGRSPFSGHYRAFLRTERTMSRDCSLGPHPDQPDATYFADDGIPAVLATDADWSFIHRNAYMLWYVRDN